MTAGCQLIPVTHIFIFWTQFAFLLYRVHINSVHIQAGMLPSRKIELAVHTWFSSNHLSRDMTILSSSTLKAFGPKRALGVISFDVANTSTAQLQEWNDLGVRGVCLKFQSSGDTPPAKELKDMLHTYADAIRPFYWVLQVYISMKDIPSIESVIPTLGMKAVFDHLGHPEIPKSHTFGTGRPEVLNLHALTGFDSMLQLLKQNNT
jgi:predicted TIM-barrel fold metal-dependent hydrolase